MKFQEKDIPTQALQELGLHNGIKDSLNPDIKKQLLNGSLTDFVQLKNIPVNGKNISLDAKLSLRAKADGSTSLLIHPIYSKKQEHNMLSTEENLLFQKEGVHSKKVAAYGIIVDYGKDFYQFDKTNKESFFIRLQKNNGENVDIWGADLERALIDSKKKIGDKVQLENLGTQQVKVNAIKRDEQGNVIGEEYITAHKNEWLIKDYKEQEKSEKTLLFEYDEETKSFIGVDADEILVPDTINGMHLSEEQKREFKDGKIVTLPDNTAIQASPAQKNGLISNKRILIASVLLDGGISFAMYHIMKGLFNKFNESKKLEKEYAKGYLEALNKMKADLQKKQAQYPNSKEITRDLNILQREISEVSIQNPKAVDINKNVNEIKQKVNDPELDDNALRVEKEEKHKNEMKQEDEKEIDKQQSPSFKR